MSASTDSHSAKTIVSGKIPPWPDDMSRTSLRGAALCSVIGVIATLVGNFWPAVEVWTTLPAVLLLLGTVVLLLPFWRGQWPWRRRVDMQEFSDEIRKLHRHRKV